MEGAFNIRAPDEFALAWAPLGNLADAVVR